MTNYRMTNDECHDRGLESTITAACRHSLRNRHSASPQARMLVLIAICLPLFIIMAAFAVDVAWMQLTRTELRTATDAAVARRGQDAQPRRRPKRPRAPPPRTPPPQPRRRRRRWSSTNDDIEIGIGAKRPSDVAFNFTPAERSRTPSASPASGTAGSAAGPVALLLGRVMGVTHVSSRSTSPRRRSSTATSAWSSTAPAR